MAIVGAHMLLYTPEPEALRSVLRETIGWKFVEGHDPPDGWQIFKLPPSELGIHPSDRSRHEICLMCDDIEATVEELRTKGIEFRGEPRDERFGIAITMLLPGGVEVLLYEPTHPTALEL